MTNEGQIRVALALRRFELPLLTTGAVIRVLRGFARTLGQSMPTLDFPRYKFLATLNSEVLKPEVLDAVYQRTAKKVKEQFAHVPEELRLKRVELNRAETRVHNFVEFIASGRATPALGDALAQAEQQVKA